MTDLLTPGVVTSVKKQSLFNLASVAALFVSFFFFLPPLDTDLGWHLRYGQYFWQAGHFLKQNSFTVLMPAYSWSNSYTLYQALSYVIFNIFGFVGLAFASALLFAAVFYFFYLLLEKKLYLSLFFFFLLSFFSWHIFYLGWRAQLFSFLGLEILLFLLIKGGKYLYFLPLLFFLWANLHGGFVLGIGLLIIYFVNFRVSPWRAPKTDSAGQRTILIFITSALATLLNPYGIGVWWEAYHHLQMPMHSLIAEWVRPPPVLTFVIVASFLISLFLLVRSKNSWRLFLGLVLTAFFYLALSARRNTDLFMLIVIYTIFSCSKLKKWEKNINFRSFIKAGMIVVVVSALMRAPSTLAVNSWEKYSHPTRGSTQPYQAVEFIKTQGIKGNFFNAYEWGGFLEWQLPDSKFFVDGRMPASGALW